MELINQFVFIIIAATDFFLAFAVLFSNKKLKSNRYFFLASIFVFLWISFGFIGFNIALPLLFIRLNFAAVSLFIVSFYFFSRNFPIEDAGIKFILNIVVVVTGLFFALLSIFSSFVIQSVSVSEKTYQMGSASNYFYIYVLAVMVYTLVILIIKFRGLDNVNKSKIAYLLVGIFLFAFFNTVFNVLFPLFVPNGKQFYQFGDYSTVFLVALTSYAIVRHHLFNIKVIATETIVVALSLGLLTEIFLSNSITEGVLKAIVWLLATYGGYQLIKAVKIEIKQREDLAVLAKQLEDANSHLKEIDKLKDDFLSMASHELNTPIAAIEGYLSMILQEGMGGKIPDKAREYLQTVFTSSQRLASLVKDLLNVSRIESGRIHIIYEQKQIADIIDQAVMEVMSKAREAKHTLIFEKPGKPVPLTYLDVTRVTEIMINMLGNSIKYTPPGGKITVRAVSDGKKIVVSVEDNGKGIPKERAVAVFEKFTQVDVMKDEVKGTGLGMYIAKKFIELMNGQIWFQSPGEGKGTTFYISLPVLAEKPADPHEGEGEVLH